MSPTLIIIGVVALIALIILVILLIRGNDTSDRATQDRLNRFVSDFERPKAQENKETESEQSVNRFRNIDEALESRGFAQRIATELIRANLKLTVTEYIMLQILSIGGIAALAFFIYQRNPIMTLVGGILGFFIPRIWLSVRKARRLRMFNDQLGDTITLMANGLRAGYSLLMAMENVGTEMPNPIAEEFNRVVREIQLGIPQERAMLNLHRRIPSDDLELMITSVNVAVEVGGNMAEILDILGHTIRERVRIAGEIKTLTAQGMLSGYIISGLPVALGLILFAMNQEYLGRMIYSNGGGGVQPCGWIMISVGVIMIALGFTAIMKIVRIDI